MAITTGAQLATAVGNWMLRADFKAAGNEVARIPEFVVLAEAKIFRTLRTPEMLTKNATFSITGEYVAVPTGYLEQTAFYHNTTPYEPLAFASPDVQSAYTVGGNARPEYFSIVGTNFRFAPVPDATYSTTLVYYAAPTTVSTGSTEQNWLLTAHPDIYLYATLAEAAAYVQDDQRAQQWSGAFDAAMGQLRRQGNRMRWGGNSMAVRPG